MAEQGFPIKELGQAIREQRQAAGLSQGRVAQKVGYNLRTIQRWEDGETMKARDKLDGIALAIGCSENELVARAYELAGREAPTSPPTGEERLGEMIRELKDGQADLIGRIAHLEHLLEDERKSEPQPDNSDGENHNP